MSATDPEVATKYEKRKKNIRSRRSEKMFVTDNIIKELHWIILVSVGQMNILKLGAVAFKSTH